MSSAEKTKPNWVEVCTLLGMITALISGGFGFILYDRRISMLEIERTENEVRKSRTPLVDVQGQILIPREFTQIEGESLGVHPVVVQIKNTGDPIVDIGSIELRYYRGNVSEVSLIEQRKVLQVHPIQKIDPPNTESKAVKERIAGSTTAVIDIDSNKWREIPELGMIKKLSNCKIPHGQVRQHTFHLLLPVPVQGEFRRVTITVNPAKGEGWQPLTWSGYADPNFCFPEPFSPGLQTDIINLYSPNKSVD